MSYESESATRYRTHAEELRTIADSDRLEETRRMLMGVAAHYEKMARILDELDFIHKNRRMPVSSTAGESHLNGFLPEGFRSDAIRLRRFSHNSWANIKR